MLSILRTHIIKVILIIIILILIAVGIIFYKQSKDRQEQIEALTLEMESLEEELLVYETAPTALMLKTNRNPDQLPNKNDFVEVKILSEDRTIKYPTNINDFKEYRYIASLHKGTILTEDLLYKEAIGHTDKWYNVYLDVMQIELKEGDTITVNLIDPSGGPYTIFGKKLVRSIYGNMVTLQLSAEEYAMLRGAYTDLYLNPGSTIESATYVQPSMQKAATPFYAPSEDVLRVMDLDPNIENKVMKHINERNRSIFVSNTIKGEDEIEAILKGRSSYISEALDGREERLRGDAREKKAREKEEGEEDEYNPDDPYGQAGIVAEDVVDTSMGEDEEEDEENSINGDSLIDEEIDPALEDALEEAW